MRDLVFKNLTSTDRKRKILASYEVSDKAGIRSVIQRHFIYMVKEVEHGQLERPQPYLYVLKKHNNRQQIEKFFCRLKGSVCVVSRSRLYMIYFMHSLKIILTPAPSNLANCT